MIRDHVEGFELTDEILGKYPNQAAAVD